MEKQQLKVVACFDIETTNNENRVAYAISYQLSILKDWNMELNSFTNQNVHDNLNITIDRHYDDICSRFDSLIEEGKKKNIVPIIMVHNLGFEMFVLASYLNKYEVNVVAKSCSKPLTISIIDSKGKKQLVFWDTFSFWQKPLGKLGSECGYPKMEGDWDYDLIRNPGTPLTDLEIGYATEDVCVPFAYLAYWLNLNPEVDDSILASRILTKTSVVRYKSLKRTGSKKRGKKTVRYMWEKQNVAELPKDNYELNLTHAATRGGFTYCASNNASKIFRRENGYHIYKYDANSMHIFHACAHSVPERFRKAKPDLLLTAFEYVTLISNEEMLTYYNKPFICAFIGVFEFTNLRLKENSLYAKNGISPLALSRFSTQPIPAYDDEENEGNKRFFDELLKQNLHDEISKEKIACFGKIEGGKKVKLILNELSSWELKTCFEWDEVKAIQDGFFTASFCKPTDKAILSFNQFYGAKQNFKHLKGCYEKKKSYDNAIWDNVPTYLKEAMLQYDESVEQDVALYYLSVKAELNSLYGIEATNEAKNDIKICQDGLYVDEYKGIEGLPKKPKAWYQYGMRIVGWSRIHQLLFMECISPVADAFICGDTDSHKVYTKAELSVIEDLLKPLHEANSRALEKTTVRAKQYGDWYDMTGLGNYEFEGEPYKFSASWNKSYIEENAEGRIDITLAGVPAYNGEHSYYKLANYLKEQGKTFDEIASLLIGYNITIDYSITGLNMRTAPVWASWFNEEVTDYLGNAELVNEPCAIHLKPMVKTIGDTNSLENHINSLYAKRNNPKVNIDNVIILWNNEQPEIIEMGD